MEANYDYFFHLENNIKLIYPQCINDELGYKENGYQFVQEVKKVLCNDDSIVLYGTLEDHKLEISIDIKGKDLYILKTYDNPIDKIRTTILVREKALNPVFNLKVEVK